MELIETLKGDIEEAKFTNGDSDENVESWGKPVVEQLEEVDEKITDLIKQVYSGFSSPRESTTTGRGEQTGISYETRTISI
jgi:hypothetical protein